MRWRASGVVVGTKYLGEVDALTEDEAKAKALRRAHVSLCHQCSRECEDPEIDEVNVEPIEDEHS